jgi:hypothetical protein
VNPTTVPASSRVGSSRNAAGAVTTIRKKLPPIHVLNAKMAKNRKVVVITRFR